MLALIITQIIKDGDLSQSKAKGGQSMKKMLVMKVFQHFSQPTYSRKYHILVHA